MGKSFEDIFKIIGPFGRYQALIHFILALITIPTGLYAFIIIFTQDIPDHYCKNPTLSNYNFTNDEIKSYSIPYSIDEKCGKIIYSDCYEYNAPWSELCGDGSCSKQDLENYSKVYANDTVKCQNGYEWLFSEPDRTSEPVEFELVCGNGEAWQVVSTSGYYLGCAIGSILGGWLLDSFGRKNVVFITGIFLSGSLVACGFANTPWLYAIMRCLVGALGQLYYIGAFIYSQELTPEKWRAKLGFVYHINFIWGQYLVVLWGWAFKDWRLANQTIAGLFIFLICLLFLDESPQYTHRTGKADQTLKSLLIIAKRNKKKDVSVSELKTVLSDIDVDITTSNYTIWNLFSYSREMTLVTLKSGYLWIAASMVYYGLGLNAGNLPGDIYMNTAISATIDLIAHIIFPFFMDWPKLGRKYTITG